MNLDDLSTEVDTFTEDPRPPRPPRPYVYLLDEIRRDCVPIPEHQLHAIIADYDRADYVESGSVICTGACEIQKAGEDRKRYRHTHYVSLAYTPPGGRPAPLREDGVLAGPGALYGLNVATGEFALYAD